MWDVMHMGREKAEVSGTKDDREGRCLWFPIKVDLLVHFPSHWLTMANKTAIPACFQGMMQYWTGLGDPCRPKIMTQEYRNLKFLGIQITREVLGGSHSKYFFPWEFFSWRRLNESTDSDLVCFGKMEWCDTNFMVSIIHHCRKWSVVFSFFKWISTH